ncbi:M4 family metallopeptidase [Vitiosangium sp. GDMCC 1.1324]|uniref:M4 family metallopeptidase n=1 Tax=Vitiosangium sp. (strain GDMCC 1.1324) TaxID=2138576 RepID=UPI001E2968F7|nr:M4 family metallopeptidase [Vitiosangium sp. GDMCC 1.1324]
MDAPSALQQQQRGDDVQAALAALGKVEVVSMAADGVPTFLRGNFGTVDTSFVAKGLHASNERAHQALLPTLRRIAPAFRLSAEDLNIRSTRTDDVGLTHARYEQVRNGLRVVGGELILHVNAAGEVYAANGNARGANEPLTLKRVSPEVAAVAAIGGVDTLKAQGAPNQVYFLSAEGELSLAYEVTVAGTREGEPARDLVYVSASSGKVLEVRPQIHSALNRALYTANNQWTTPGTLRRGEGGAATGDNHLDTNYNHIGTTYACYDTLFGRDSFDDRGAQITSTVHYGQSYVNAYWDGFQIVFGDGDNFNSTQLGLDLDVTAHEISHAVTERESGLAYRNESGALNESYSDIAAAFCESWSRGSVIDADVWKIGEDIWTPGTAGDALRYMNSPTLDGSSRDYYPERYTGTSDNGGVHWNSGIPNLAFKLLVTGGTHPRGKTAVNVTGVGMHRAAQTWYHANANYFTSTTTMSQAKTWTAQAAQDRYDATVVQAVRDAWSAVGVP